MLDIPLDRILTTNMEDDIQSMQFETATTDMAAEMEHEMPSELENDNHTEQDPP